MASLEKNKKYTKQEVKGFLADISEHVKEEQGKVSQGNYLHSMLALNELLAQPNAEKLFDDNLKSQAREIWLKFKASGAELNDPPLLFGHQKPKAKKSK